MCRSNVPLLCLAYTLVVRMLLLISGNVERNPGPISVYPEHVSLLVGELLHEIAGNWELFIGQLGVSFGDRNQIKQSNAQKPDFAKLCLLEGINIWVRSDDSPTYEKIVAVLRGNTVTNKPLATRVEQFARTIQSRVKPARNESSAQVQSQSTASAGVASYPRQFSAGYEPSAGATQRSSRSVPREESLTELNVKNAIDKVNEWFELGEQLGIDFTTLDTIQTECHVYGTGRQRSKMVHTWLARDIKASWNKLCCALDKIGHQYIAENIREKYIRY